MNNHAIGFAGAHRTGKTTLARELAAQLGLPFVQTSISQTFKQLGYDPAVDYDLPTRIMIQQKVREAEIEKWQAQTQAYVTDRTPVDMIAYTLACAHQEQITPELDAQLQAYIHDCLQDTLKYFTWVFEVLPALPIVHEPGKASSTKTHVQHIALIVSGMLMHHKFTHCQNIMTIPTQVLTLQDRVNFCKTFVNAPAFSL